MPKRQRWTPVKGTGSRVYDFRERVLLGALDLPGRLLFRARRAVGFVEAPAVDPSAIHEVLVLRLDRIGDVVMSLPALYELRAALPSARIRLAVGAWSAAVVRHAPVDEILVWSAPWAGRGSEGAEGAWGLAQRARALRASGIDVALDLQGDVRASMLLWLTGARIRAGYANTGGAWLLTHVIPLDETVSWIEQNRRAVETVLGPEVGRVTVDPLTRDDRDFAGRFREALGPARRPLIGLHPSGGRPVKQWDVARWADVAALLQREFGATIVVTGSTADKPLAEELAQALQVPPVDMTGRLGVRETMAVIDTLDLFLSSDTGPMHMACAVDTPSVSVFGPTDPVRYFSGGDGRPGSRHVVVRADLWCSPCNLVRKPPAECLRPPMPECLELVTVHAVHQEAARLLREGGFTASDS